MADRKMSIMWRYLTTVNENIANSDVCRKTIHHCGNIRWKPVKKRTPKETKGGGGGKSLRQTQSPGQRDRGHWQSPLTEAKNIQVACTVGKMMFQSWLLSALQYVNFQSDIGHHACYFCRLITKRLYSDIQIIYSSHRKKWVELFEWNWKTQTWNMKMSEHNKPFLSFPVIFSQAHLHSRSEKYSVLQLWKVYFVGERHVNVLCQ